MPFDLHRDLTSSQIGPPSERAIAARSGTVGLALGWKVKWAGVQPSDLAVSLPRGRAGPSCRDLHAAGWVAEHHVALRRCHRLAVWIPKRNALQRL